MPWLCGGGEAVWTLAVLHEGRQASRQGQARHAGQTPHKEHSRDVKAAPPRLPQVVAGPTWTPSQPFVPAHRPWHPPALQTPHVQDIFDAAEALIEKGGAALALAWSRWVAYTPALMSATANWRGRSISGMHRGGATVLAPSHSLAAPQPPATSVPRPAPARLPRSADVPYTHRKHEKHDPKFYYQNCAFIDSPPPPSYSPHAVPLAPTLPCLPWPAACPRMPRQ